MDDIPYDRPDPLLTSFYSVITSAGGEFGVTVLVSGAWVTGMAISGRAWLEQLAHVVDEAPNGGELGGVFRLLGRDIYPADSEVEAGEAEPPELDRHTHYLHLRDARMVVDGVVYMDHPTSLVRVRFGEVGAWILGNMGPDGYVPPPPPV